MDVVDVEQLIQQVKDRPDIWYPKGTSKESLKNAWVRVCKHFFPEFSLLDHARKKRIMNNLNQQWYAVMNGFYVEFSIRRRMGMPDDAPDRNSTFPYFTLMKFLLPGHTPPPLETSGRASRSSRERHPSSSSAAGPSSDNDQEFLLSLLPTFRRVPPESKQRLMCEMVNLLEHFTPPRPRWQ